jgi:hypothetical protein
MSIEFVDPPLPRMSGHDPVVTPAILAAVRERPNEWALPWKAVKKGSQSTVSTYCRRQPEFETTYRTVGHDPLTYDVYLRYVGEDA